MSLKTTADYARACEITQDVIGRWDPYKLLANGAPADEFEPAAAAVVSYIPRIQSASDAAEAVSEVFSTRFEPAYFKPEDCIKVGKDLFEALMGAGIIDDPFAG